MCVCAACRTGWSTSRLGCCAGSTTYRRWTRSATCGSDVWQHGQTRHSASGRPGSGRSQVWARCPLGSKAGLWLVGPRCAALEPFRGAAPKLTISLPLIIQVWKVSFSNSFSNRRSRRGRRVEAQRTHHAETVPRVRCFWRSCVLYRSLPK